MAQNTESTKEEDKQDEDNKSIIILAILCGGIAIGDIIALELGVKLDVVVPQKISAHFDRELAMGAIMPNSSYFSFLFTDKMIG